MSKHNHMHSKQIKYKYSEDEREEDEITAFIPDAEKSLSRVCNNDWCLCGSCTRMETEAESICCQEQPPVLLRVMQWNQQGSCVVHHPFFVSVCLNPYALQTIYSRDKKLFGSLFNKPLHEKYQITAYRTFSDYFFHSLRGSITIPLPGCVLNTIRKAFPKDAAIGSFPGYCEL
ncbi:uncharacterized protein LOC125047717 [Penaeus chinensis]|uniref:uncharacterized protein LOC125047717 n=1 Tax=Penaeus chinensis TaxID=139456 RepID=UPI001FB57086|nr:uncharacterized protein LOC125047717 [Penaeus chinensis]